MVIAPSMSSATTKRGWIHPCNCLADHFRQLFLTLHPVACSFLRPSPTPPTFFPEDMHSGSTTTSQHPPQLFSISISQEAKAGEQHCTQCGVLGVSAPVDFLAACPPMQPSLQHAVFAARTLLAHVNLAVTVSAVPAGRLVPSLYCALLYKQPHHHHHGWYGAVKQEVKHLKNQY